MFQAQELKRLGISQSAVIQPNEIVFDDEVRAICAGNACRQYGRTWVCPPGWGRWSSAGSGALPMETPYCSAPPTRWRIPSTMRG